MDLTIVRWLQSIRTPFLDWFFYIITQLGDQYAFIVIAVVIYWTIDKRFAHKFVFAFMISASVNALIKNIVQRPRPYLYPNVETEPHWLTEGFSFPSGHAQAAGVLGYTALHTAKRLGKRWLRQLGIAIMILVPLSRIYLGQHFLSDVLVGVLLSYGLASLMFKVVDKMGEDEATYTLMLAPIFMLSMFFIQSSDLYVAVGGFAGFALGYFLEKKYIAFDVKATLWIQVVKVIFGVAIALAIKEGLKLVFPDRLFFDFFRYFLIGAWAALGAPYVYKHVIPHLQKNVRQTES